MSAQRMKSYFSRMSPVPAFPEYTGPYKVGTVDVEIPVSKLDSPSPTPDAAANIHTIQFRVFYPATPDSKGPPITWLPAPQRLHVAAYTQFLGLNPMMASVLSFLPRHLYYTYVPVTKNAPLQPPNTPNGRWPTVIFSHGLGGNRNAYSYVSGCLASHGVVVVCPEHRDGSAGVSIIRDPQAQGHSSPWKSQRLVPYVRIPHTQTPEIWRARDTQIRVRLWELGLLVEAVLGIDSGMEDLIGSNMNRSTTKAALQQFAAKMDVQEPGKIILGGHSFGAATIVQLLKLTYYADRPEVTSMPDPVFAPAKDSNIRRLLTEKTPTILLDMWCFPLVSATVAPLLPLPLPAYADVPTAPGGTAVLAIESEAFHRWTEHLHTKARILSPDPSARIVALPPPQAAAEDHQQRRHAGPSFFYAHGSAHLNQSDFGVLFPWVCRRVFGAKEPERAMRLNVRAMLQHLRANAVPVARTWAGDLVDGPGAGAGKKPGAGRRASAGARPGGGGGDQGLDDGTHDDGAIMRRGADGEVEGWCWIDIAGLGGRAGRTELESLARPEKEDGESSEGEDPERQMEGEMEPGVTPIETGAPVGDVRRAAVGAAAA